MSGLTWATSAATNRGIHGEPVARFLSCLEGVKKSSKGWRAKCPSCGGSSNKLSIMEASSGAVLARCFAGCTVADVAHAVGLRVSQLFPASQHPYKSKESLENRNATRQSGWSDALDVLGKEATVVLIASRMICQHESFSAEDDARLNLAIQRISDARQVLCAR